MNNNYYRFLLLLFAGTILFISACKTSNRATLKQPLKEYGFDYLYPKLLENQLNFEYLSGKFTIDYVEGRKKTGLKGQLRIRKDSATWFSFSPALGIEAARVLLTNDSVKFINRLNKKYVTGKYNLIDSLLNTTIDYSILQAMIVGNDLAQYDIDKFRSSIDGGLYRITIQERKKIKEFLKSGEYDSRVLIQQIWLDPETFKIRRVDLKELNGDNKKLVVYYDDYEAINGQLFPKRLYISISSQKQINIDVKFIKAEINKPLQFPFRIPKKYEKLF
jgi:hypothetical protein